METWSTLSQYARTISLSVAKLDLFVYDAGQTTAPAVVLLHGLGDESDTWRHAILPLARQQHVLAPDLPGFGRSQKPARACAIPFYAGVILEMLDTLQIEQAVLVGNSMGAVISHFMALTFRKRIKGLVLVDGSLLVKEQNLNARIMLFMIPVLGEWLYTRLRKDPQAAYETLHAYYANLGGLPKEDQAFLYQRVQERVWSDTQRWAYFSALRSLVSFSSQQRNGLEQRLSALSIPTRVIWGQADQIVPLANAHALSKAQPSAQLKVIPNCGHMPQQEKPPEFLEALFGDERLALSR